METPVFSFYSDDLQANGSVSERAVVRECGSSGLPVTTKLISELKYLNQSNEPISVNIGGKEVFVVRFLDKDESH